jgi:hypothetical protein
MHRARVSRLAPRLDAVPILTSRVGAELAGHIPLSREIRFRIQRSISYHLIHQLRSALYSNSNSMTIENNGHEYMNYESPREEQSDAHPRGNRARGSTPVNVRSIS